MRYVYASYKTRERAETGLEDMFAEGEVSRGEAPRIEPKRDHRQRVVAYQVTLEDWS